MGKKKKILIFFFIIFFFSLLNKQTYALGLVSEADKRISFEHGLERTYEFLVQHTTRDVQIIVGGYPIEYVTLSRDYIKAEDPDKSFYVKIKFPAVAPKPGHHSIKVQANEFAIKESGFAALVSVATDIKIDVLYPGKYAEVRFGDISVVNNTAYFTISANNFGLQTINSFKAKIDIFDSEGNKIDSIYTNEKSIESDKTEIITAELNINGYEVGDYKAKAFVFWDNNQTTLEKAFRVGALRINIVDYTKEFYAGTINKFDIMLENVWNDEIKDVYVIVRINNEELRSATENIAPFSTKTFSVYWDATNVLPGEYGVEIKAYYLDKSTMEIGKVRVIEKKTEVKLAKETKKLPLVTILLVAIIILVLMIDVIWMKIRKKKEKL